MADSRRRFSRLAAASEHFTPGSPIDSLGLFSGRLEQVSDIMTAFHARGQHVALYGERGVGKTSLANVLAEALSARPNATSPLSARVGCSSADDYQSIWETAFKKLGIAFSGEALFPETVREHLEQLEKRTLIIIDEFDRLKKNAEATSLFADTIKLLSDEPSRATILIVGVADSIDELVEDHKSVGRALKQVQLPRMRTDELKGILQTGAKAAELKMTGSQMSRITELSEGLPHFTHALGLYATERAIADDRDEMTDNDISAAIHLSVRKAQQTIIAAYKKATRSARQDVLYEEVLLGCALAHKDEIGMFAARDVVIPLSSIMGMRYEIPAFAKHLKKFSGDDQRGGILQRHGEDRRYFYRFDDPMMQPFVILNGLAEGKVDEAQLAEIREAIKAAAR